MISLYTHYVSRALQLFGVMFVPSNHSTFNSIIVDLFEMQDELYKAIEFYGQMQDLGLKPVFAFLHSCVGIAASNMIKEVHEYCSDDAITFLGVFNCA